MIEIIDEPSKVFPTTCDYRQKSISSLIVRMGDALKLFDLSSEANTNEILGKIRTFEGNEEMENMVQSYVTKFLHAKSKIDALKSKLNRAKIQLRASKKKMKGLSSLWSRAWITREKKFKRALKKNMKYIIVTEFHVTEINE